MGLGKTVQLLMALPHGPALVLCPAIAIGTWEREIRRWRPDRLPVALKRKSFEFLPHPYVGIISYDSLPDAFPPPETTVLGDEIHACKSSRTLRTRAFRMLALRALASLGRVWIATGTPIENRPQELWNILQSAQLAGEAFGDFGAFAEMFGGIPKGKRGAWKTVGGERTFVEDVAGSEGSQGYDWSVASPRARECLRRVMLRRTRAEVLPDLPGKTYATLAAVLSPTDTERANRFKAVYLREGESAADLHARLSRPATFEAVSSILEALSTAKIPALLEHVATFEDAGEPLVVASLHRRPIEALQKRRGWLAILGEDSHEARASKVESFQRGDSLGIAGTIGAMGTSVTLTRASKLLFCGRAWNPEKNRQMEDRVCRIGQDRGVTIYDLVSRHPLDERLYEVLADKRDLIDSVL
jgi:SNF2 family DNA or RNA helicase